MPTRVLLTGATGALGRALLPELLLGGFEVLCLIRAQKGQTAEQRLRSIIDHPRARAVSGDITEPLCGLDPATLPSIQKLVHSAADINLSQANEAGALESNLEGTRNVLALAEAMQRPDFHYVGTAYIAGDAPVLVEHEPGDPLTVGQPRNPYEASKVKAETMVRAYAGRFSVQRPSIVVGRSDDGRAEGLEGIYTMLRSVTRLRDTIRRGNYKDEKGVRIGRGYKLKVPVGIGNQEDVDLNMVPLDWVAETQAALVALPARGCTYNLTHPQSMHLTTLIREMIEALDLRHVTVVEDEGGWTMSPIKLAIRRVIAREIAHLQPYLQRSPEFVSRNIYRDLGPNWPKPPAISVEFLRRTIRALDKASALVPA